MSFTIKNMLLYDIIWILKTLNVYVKDKMTFF